MKKFRFALAAALAMCVAGKCVVAQEARVWLSPPTPLEQPNGDFQKLFSDPSGLASLSSSVGVFVLPINYVVSTPAATIAQDFALLHSRGIETAVTLLALPVDKKVCGNGIEGTVWPGEPAQYARKLRALNINIDYFLLDGPLTSGHSYRGQNACGLSIAETAKRVAGVMETFQNAFPVAKFIDVEPPTSLPLAEWKSTLTQWLSLIEQDFGRPLYGFEMDINWAMPWTESVVATDIILHSQGIRSGAFLNAPSNFARDPNLWIGNAKRNYCSIYHLGAPFDFLTVSNWSLMTVKNMPPSNQSTLTSLAEWVASSPGC